MLVEILPTKDPLATTDRKRKPIVMLWDSSLWHPFSDFETPWSATNAVTRARYTKSQLPRVFASLQAK